jgi:hypothetical protein
LNISKYQEGGGGGRGGRKRGGGKGEVGVGPKFLTAIFKTEIVEEGVILKTHYILSGQQELSVPKGGVVA